MDKIFREIKNAIEEEMRNAESGPPPGGGRSQAGGGRRAQEYAEWLKEEQARLRGDGAQPAARPAPIEDVQMQMPDQPEPRRDRQQNENRSQAQPRPPRRPDRQRSEGSSRQQHENRAAERRQQQQQRQRPRQQSQRQYRQERDAYQLRSASAMSGQIKRLLRSPNGLRQAFLLREIISKPVSLRDKDDHLIS